MSSVHTVPSVVRYVVVSPFCNHVLKMSHNASVEVGSSDGQYFTVFKHVLHIIYEQTTEIYKRYSDNMLTLAA